MKNKHLQLVFTFLFTLVTSVVQAQIPAEPDTTLNKINNLAARRWQLELSVTQPLAGEFRLHFFHKVNKKWDAGVFAGYRIPVYAPINLLFDIVDDPLVEEASQSRSGDFFSNDFASGYLLGISAKKHIAKGGQSFLQCDLFARRWQMPENRSTIPFSNTEFILNERAMVYGSKFLFGREWTRVNPSKKLNLGFNAYFGAGFRIIRKSSDFTQIDSNGISTSLGSNENKIRPSLHLGFNLFLVKRK
jgi:hypothetical protein